MNNAYSYAFLKVLFCNYVGNYINTLCPSFVAVPLFVNFLKCLVSFHSIKYYKFMKHAHVKNLSVISLVYLLLNIKNYESRYRPYMVQVLKLKIALHEEGM